MNSRLVSLLQLCKEFVTSAASQPVGLETYRLNSSTPIFFVVKMIYVRIADSKILRENIARSEGSQDC